jgi:hypothetical protein
MALPRVGLALRANLAASRELSSRVGARLRLDLLCKQGRGEATPLPSLRTLYYVLCTLYSVLCTLYSVLCTLISTFAQAIGRFAPLHCLPSPSPIPNPPSPILHPQILQ